LQIIGNESTGASTIKQTLQTVTKKPNTEPGLLWRPEVFKALRQQSLSAEAGVRQSLLLHNILQINDLWRIPGRKSVLCFVLLGQFVAELRYLFGVDDMGDSVSGSGYFYLLLIEKEGVFET